MSVCPALGTSNGNYESIMNIPMGLREAFSWCKRNIFKINSKIKQFSFTLEIYSDASLTGWDIVCGDKRTYGHWNSQEKSFHINQLKL